MEAMILAGGLGTRLSSRLSGVPKSMAMVAGRPFLEILFDQLIGAGCGRLILSVGHLRQVILDAYRDSYQGVPLHYVVEETPLGTGGAIRSALPHAQEPSVLVLNGDTFLEADFRAMHTHHLSVGRPMTMAVTHVENMGRYGGVTIDNGQVSGFIEKGSISPGWINAGAYVLSKDFSWPGPPLTRFSFETDVLAPFLDQLRPAAYHCEGYFLDIGIPEDLDRAEVEIAARNRRIPR